MAVGQRIVGDVAVVTVHGEITLNKGTDVEVRDKVRSLVQQGFTKLVLDLGDVPYVDSAGLGELTHAYVSAKRAGGEVKLARPTKRLSDLLAITKLVTVFECHDSEAAAIASFGASV